MLRLITALAITQAAATTPPGTGYSDADSCPPPETTPFGAVEHVSEWLAEVKYWSFPSSHDVDLEAERRRMS